MILTISVIALFIILLVSFYFNVESPSTPVGIPETIPPAQTPAGMTKIVSIISISRQPSGDIIRISGISGLSGNSSVIYDVWPADIIARKMTADEVTGLSGRTSVSGEDGGWAVNLNMGSFGSGKYIVNAWPEQSGDDYGDRKVFFIPLNETVSRGAGWESGTGEIILNEIPPSEVSQIPLSKTPIPTPDQVTT